MERRKFLKFSAVGLTTLIALPGLGYVSTSVEKGAVSLIMKEFNYLKLEKAGVEQFVQDFFKIYHYSFTNQVKIKAYSFMGIQAKSSSLVENLTHLYILSTDFFMNRMDESLTVKYMGLYNPYSRPCANPFSNIYYPQGV